MRRFRVIILAVAFLPAVRARAEGQPAEAGDLEFFEKRVRPVLVEHCYKCHSTKAQKLKGSLLLDSREGLMKGGDTGPVIDTKQPENSRLLEAIGYKNVDLQMPPKGKLPDAVIADLTAWVKHGAAWPAEKTTSKAAKDGFDLQERKKSHWAWQPIRVPSPPPSPYPLPQIGGEGRVRGARSPVDAFVLARLEAKGLKPAAAADRRTLLRRVTFDVIGLPPTLEEIDAFLKDDSPNAFAKVVDRLLASPRFGERWGRHWLDLVRYAESRGHEQDYTTPNAYQYRDYVIRALNADVPYDQFVTEHIAGDLLERPRLHPGERFNESILGTGFWFLGEEIHSPVDPRQDEADRFDNRIDVMTKTFLGLTVSCARCHDHKFDAISAKDYYALFGFLESSSYRLVCFDSLEQNRRVTAELARLRERVRPELHRAIATALRPTAERLSDYLLAAREALLAGPDDDAKPGQPIADNYRRRLSTIAEAHRLNADMIGAWMTHLTTADADDPFHAWAHVAGDAQAGEPARLAEIIGPLAAALKEKDRSAEASLKNAQVIIDYSTAKPADWMPDDSGFGAGSRRPGDISLSGDSARPAIRLTERGAAVYDLAWDDLRYAVGAENDPSAIGRMFRAGRSLRTPSFSLTTGRLFYLMRGVGQAYVAVGQHTLINGPLHAKLVAPINTNGKYRWVSHDLTVYKGQLAHVEFTAQGGHDFEVALVVQAEQTPAERPSQSLLQLLTGDQARSLPALASGYQRMFLDACEKLERGGTQASPRPRFGGEGLEVRGKANPLTPNPSPPSTGARGASWNSVNWALAHPDLFGNGEEAATLADTAERCLAEEKKVLGQARFKSRLALAMLDGNGVDERVFVRGSPKALGEPTPRRFLEALAGPAPLRIQRGSGRLELARQMTDPAINPLLPRVMVNRIWHHLFGRGLVASVDNFGVLGEAPTHPELLDYLADRFVKDGWSIKRLIRALVLTSAYQMSSAPPSPYPLPPQGGEGRVGGVEEAEQHDPQNLLLHRMRVRRLEGEAIRDAILAVSGRLNERMYGPSVPVHLTPFLDGRGRPTTGPLDSDGRRSLYLAVRRNFLSPFLLTFDTPIPFSTVGRRTVSNVPAQALILMNDPFVHQQAETWARRVLSQPGSAEERIERMFVSAFGRAPTDSERAACRAFIAQQARLHHVTADDVPPWKDLAHALFNVKEFIFLN
jgi:hypothetical protein